MFVVIGTRETVAVVVFFWVTSVTRTRLARSRSNAQAHTVFFFSSSFFALHSASVSGSLFTFRSAFACVGAAAAAAADLLLSFYTALWFRFVFCCCCRCCACVVVKLAAGWQLKVAPQSFYREWERETSVVSAGRNWTELHNARLRKIIQFRNSGSSSTGSDAGVATRWQRRQQFDDFNDSPHWSANTDAAVAVAAA